MNLTDEQLNIAICEWRGWTDIGSNGFGFAPTPLLKYGVAHKQQLPSHITGVEALGNMHEAEKGLESVDALESRREFISHLMRLVGVSPDMEGKWSFVQDFALTHSTARQRAVALLRVVKPELF
jgi:hypothetical protein